MPKTSGRSMSYIKTGAKLAYQTYKGYKQWQKFKRRLERSGGRRKRRRTRVTVNKPPIYGVHKFKGRLTEQRVKKKLRAVCQFMKNQEAVHVHRSRHLARCVVLNVNRAAICPLPQGGRTTDIESAMSNLRYFDPATNSLVTADPSLGLYTRDIRVKISRTVRLYNNYHIPCMVELYSCIPRDATNLDAKAAYEAGMLDQIVDGTSNLSPMVFIKDSKTLRAMYHVKKVVSKKLAPGQMCKGVNLCKEFEYDFSSVDTHGQLYQKNKGGHCWILRIQGMVGHDSNGASELGQLKCGIDTEQRITYTFTYDAGKDLHEISVNDDAATVFTSGVGVVSQKPLVAQQSYTA